MSVNNFINKPLKVATAFSGGLAAVEFALKYENINHEIVFACEFDKYARKQYLQFHQAPEKFYEDIQNLNANKYKGQINLFVWGSPCQDLSLAGNRKGFNGSKSSLFREGARIQKEMMPETFIFENVEGLLSSNGGADYKEVCKTFREQGYHLVLLKMNTKDYGIPQNRPRIFIVGFLDVENYTRFKIPEPTKLELRLKDMLQDWIPKKYFLSQRMLNGFVSGKSEFKNRFKTKNQNSNYATCLDTREGNRRTNNFIKVGYINQDTQASTVFSANGICSTLNAGMYGYEQGYIFNNSIIRKLTPFECFRLQGVKDRDIKLVNSDTQSYKIAGNAISVNVMQQLFKSLYKKDELEKTSLFDFLSTF